MTIDRSFDEPNDQFPVGMRVLAVDDDPICLKLLETLLRKCQYHGQPPLSLYIYIFSLLVVSMFWSTCLWSFYYVDLQIIDCVVYLYVRFRRWGSPLCMISCRVLLDMLSLSSFVASNVSVTGLWSFYQMGTQIYTIFDCVLFFEIIWVQY